MEGSPKKSKSNIVQLSQLEKQYNEWESKILDDFYELFVNDTHGDFITLKEFLEYRHKYKHAKTIKEATEILDEILKK